MSFAFMVISIFELNFGHQFIWLGNVVTSNQ